MRDSFLLWYGSCVISKAGVKYAGQRFVTRLYLGAGVDSGNWVNKTTDIYTLKCNPQWTHFNTFIYIFSYTFTPLNTLKNLICQICSMVLKHSKSVAPNQSNGVHLTLVLDSKRVTNAARADRTENGLVQCHGFQKSPQIDRVWRDIWLLSWCRERRVNWR